MFVLLCMFCYGRKFKNFCNIEFLDNLVNLDIGIKVLFGLCVVIFIIEFNLIYLI